MDGIEYDTVLSQLNANPNMTADQVASASSASAIVEKTYSSMAVDDRYLALRTAVNDWSIALRNALPAQKTAITRGFSNAKSFWQAPTDKDLYDLAKQINAQVTDNALKAKGTAVMNAVDAVVLHRRFTGKAYNMVHGITITGITRPVERKPTGPTTTRSISPFRRAGTNSRTCSRRSGVPASSAAGARQTVESGSRARELLPIVVPALVVGAGSALSPHRAHRRRQWARGHPVDVDPGCPRDRLGVPGWIFATLTLTGIAIGIVVTLAPGHADRIRRRPD